MDRIAAVSVVLGSAAVVMAACLFTFWLRRHRAKSLIRGLFEDYFDERFAADELGRRVRANVSGRWK
jgi:F0F1-type ATP synthase assembly protein I